MSEWAVPSFIIPKKNGTLCIISDFRELNKKSIGYFFPIPKIFIKIRRFPIRHLS